MSGDIVGKLWNYCHELRHIGVNNNDYLEQITCLLFLKMADERGIELPSYEALDPATKKAVEVSCDWPTLIKYSGSDLITHYTNVLAELATQQGMLGDIFARAAAPHPVDGALHPTRSPWSPRLRHR